MSLTFANISTLAPTPLPRLICASCTNRRPPAHPANNVQPALSPRVRGRPHGSPPALLSSTLCPLSLQRTAGFHPGPSNPVERAVRPAQGEPGTSCRREAQTARWGQGFIAPAFFNRSLRCVSCEDNQPYQAWRTLVRIWVRVNEPSNEFNLLDVEFSRFASAQHSKQRISATALRRSQTTVGNFPTS